MVIASQGELQQAAAEAVTSAAATTSATAAATAAAVTSDRPESGKKLFCLNILRLLPLSKSFVGRGHIHQKLHLFSIKSFEDGYS